MYKTCENCGAPLAKGVRFCTGCGTPVPREVEPEPAVTETPMEELRFKTEEPRWEETHREEAPSFEPAPETPGKTYRGRPWPEKGDPFRPIGVWQYLGIFLLLSIPVVNILFIIIWACGGCKKVNVRNLARAILVMVVLSLVIILILGMLAAIYQDEIIHFVIEQMEEELGDMPYLPTYGYDYNYGFGGFEHGWQS